MNLNRGWCHFSNSAASGQMNSSNKKTGKISMIKEADRDNYGHTDYGKLAF